MHLAQHISGYIPSCFKRYNLEFLENTPVCIILLWSPRPGSNWLPPPYQGDALPTELRGQDYKICPGISPLLLWYYNAYAILCQDAF